MNKNIFMGVMHILSNIQHNYEADFLVQHIV